ncbi:MAG TPA: class I SAM-dependent methyltransferase, partial [Pyrinomonadaceae bacterium]
RVKIHQGISLDVLPTLTDPFDCILIDGDHNWYTVYHELKIIEERGLQKAGGAIFFHDVGWPYARRDMYYQPELIPQQFRHPHEQKGIAPGRAELSAEAEFNSTHHNAVREGGARNGVLTAVEDFLKEQPGQFRFVRIEAEFGLGALFKKKDFRANLAFTGFLLKAKTFEHQLKLKEAFRRKLPFLFSSLARLRQRSRRREQAL